MSNYFFKFVSSYFVPQFNLGAENMDGTFISSTRDTKFSIYKPRLYTKLKKSSFFWFGFFFGLKRRHKREQILFTKGGRMIYIRPSNYPVGKSKRKFIRKKWLSKFRVLRKAIFKFFSQYKENFQLQSFTKRRLNRKERLLSSHLTWMYMKKFINLPNIYLLMRV